jgi:hypothetical protein
LINLAATPGLGSLIARRFWAGTGQLLLALAGFGLIVAWMFEAFYRTYLANMGEPVPPESHGWMGKWGLICFGAGWLWSLVTSISIWWHSNPDELAGPGPVPPRLAKVIGKPPKLS